jgi:hypothetical protein
VDGVSLARNGRSVSAPDADLTRLLGTAHTNGLRAELLLSNYSNRIGDFDSQAAAKSTSSRRGWRRRSRCLSR